MGGAGPRDAPNAVVKFNRAIAIGGMWGAVAGLDALESLDSLDVTQLDDQRPHHAARR